ncbi:MAG: hypothetical protein HYX92_07935 [Chloroflexi bacterium]|nr:hypothetical protein [Chloroflexota bacterium]
MQEQQLIVLDPTEQPRPGTFPLAQRLGSLEGKVIGCLWNSKPHGDRVLKLLSDRLLDKYGAKSVHVQKVIIGSRAPREVLDNLISNCDAVIAALGD